MHQTTEVVVIQTAPTAIEDNSSSSITKLSDLVIAHCLSKHTRRAYSLHIRNYLASGRPLNRESLADYLYETRARGVSVANQAMAAIKKLAKEAWLRKLISNDDYFPLRELTGIPERSVKVGNWLAIEGAKKLIAAPNRMTLQGTRDAALLALLLGCGLRKAEAASITWDRYQSRDGRMCLVDFIGKGQKSRTVPVPEWARKDLDRWLRTLEKLSHDSDCGPVNAASTILRANSPLAATTRLDKLGGRTANGDYLLYSAPLSEQGVWWVVSVYARKLGLAIKPHDLRRTVAKLMRSAGAELEQIQLTLGHANLATTERYLGGALELAAGEAGIDKIRMELTKEVEEQLEREGLANE